jgi:hypothetical protein
LIGLAVNLSAGVSVVVRFVMFPSVMFPSCAAGAAAFP